MIDNHINYIEFKTTDLEKTKHFYTSCFGWSFTDYGKMYASFSDSNSGVNGGFEFTNEPIKNGALIVLYCENLNKIKEKIIAFGGKISKDIFSFPGGKRFQFLDSSGNELAVWSDK